jgi:hypothetical protein
MMDVLRRGNLGALLLPLVLLTIGAAARARLARKTVPYHWRGVQLTHPAGWTVADPAPGASEVDSVELVDLLGPGRIKPRVTLRIAPLPPSGGDEAVPGEAEKPDPANDSPGADTVALPPAISATLSNRLPLYYVIGDQPVRIGDQEATRVESAFAFTPRPVPGRKLARGRKGDIPVVMRAIDVVLLRGDDALSVQVAAPIEDFETQRPVLEAIISSLRLDPTTTAPASEASAVPVAGEPAPSSEAATASNGVTVTGQVIDAESGLAVPGAIVVFMAPGTTVDSVTDDNLTESAYTTGLADSTGTFATNRGLGRPGKYGVMVVADGYRWVGTDQAVTVGAETPSPVNLGVVPLRRR